MITKENIGNETFESMTINDTPALFTDMRIDRNAVPEGLYAYDIRESDDGDRLEGWRSEVESDGYGKSWRNHPDQERVYHGKGRLCTD